MPAGRAGSAPEADAAAAEQRQRDLEARKYDRLVGLRLFSLAEVPALLGPLAAAGADRVVEVGCGTGRLTLPLARTGAAVVAVDHSWDSLRVLREKLSPGERDRVLLVQGDAACLPVRSGWASRALTSQVLQHLASDGIRRRAVAELARVLRPGGRLAVSVYRDTPALRAMLPREGRHSGAIPFRRLREPELAALLEPEFEVERIRGTLIYVTLAHGRRRG